MYELALAAASFGKIHGCFLTCNEKKVLRMHVALNRKNDLSLKRVTQDFRHIIDVEPAIKAATEVDRKPPLKIFVFFFFFFFFFFYELVRQYYRRLSSSITQEFYQLWLDKFLKGHSVRK